MKDLLKLTKPTKLDEIVGNTNVIKKLKQDT